MKSVFVRNGVLLLVTLGLALFRANASAGPVEVRWNELATLLVGHHVSIPLAGGVVVEGETLSVRDESLMLDIWKTSDSSRYPKGQAPIPRASITVVRIMEQRGSGGRILGTIVGAIVGMVAGGEIAAHGANSEAAGIITFTASAVACTVAGYYAGRSSDRHSTWLRIAPQSAGSDLPARGVGRLAEAPSGDPR
jgi:hypothetical protein